jgi:hypothetical protein
MEQDPCNELHSDDTIELTQWGLRHPGETAIYEKDGWLLTVISDKVDLWKIETPDGALIIAIGNILSHIGYNDELFHISRGNELLLEWMGGIVKKHGITKRSPLMFYVKGTTRLLCDGNGLWRLCLPNSSFTAGSGDLFRDDAFDKVREGIISQCCEKFIDALKMRFEGFYKNHTEYDLKVLPNEGVWILSYYSQKYMGFGNAFVDGVFAQAFDVVDEGRLSVWLKNKFKKYGIDGTRPKLWHWVDGKYMSIVGEQAGGKVVHFKKTITP